MLGTILAYKGAKVVIVDAGTHPRFRPWRIYRPAHLPHDQNHGGAVWSPRVQDRVQFRRAAPQACIQPFRREEELRLRVPPPRRASAPGGGHPTGHPALSRGLRSPPVPPGYAISISPTRPSITARRSSTAPASRMSRLMPTASPSPPKKAKPFAPSSSPMPPAAATCSRACGICRDDSAAGPPANPLPLHPHDRREAV